MWLQRHLFLWQIVLGSLFLQARAATPGEKLRIIVIDPGHGGKKDPGACGAKRNKEKDITLGVALKLGDWISQNMPGVEVRFTRKTDKAVSLNDRARMGRKHAADLFISLHCNGSRNRKCHGSEVYVMGNAAQWKGKNSRVNNLSEHSLLIAKRENKVVLLEGADYKKHYSGYDPRSPVSHILFSMHQNAYFSRSLAFANYVGRQLTGVAQRVHRFVAAEGFLVLWGVARPAVLIEMGYITNPAEEKFMASAQGQRQLAAAIGAAIKAYAAHCAQRAVGKT